jgi:hypothetical protein
VHLGDASHVVVHRVAARSEADVLLGGVRITSRFGEEAKIEVRVAESVSLACIIARFCGCQNLFRPPLAR